MAIGARSAGPLHYKRRVIPLRKWFTARESAAEKQLLHRYRGDRARLERMIQLELMHRPGLSRAAGARAALERSGVAP